MNWFCTQQCEAFTVIGIEYRKFYENKLTNNSNQQTIETGNNIKKIYMYFYMNDRWREQFFWNHRYFLSITYKNIFSYSSKLLFRHFYSNLYGVEQVFFCETKRRMTNQKSYKKDVATPSKYLYLPFIINSTSLLDRNSFIEPLKLFHNLITFQMYFYAICNFSSLI